jgi:phosphate transport system substrate-binding protein
VDFGASDQPMSDEALAQAPGRILHLPTVAGAVVVSYNLPGVGALRFDGPTLADIFQGKIVLDRESIDSFMMSLTSDASL